MSDENKPDLRGPAIVIEGTVLSGFTFTGPFGTIDQAAKWYETETIAGQLKLGCTIALLERPTYLNA